MGPQEVVGSRAQVCLNQKAWSRMHRVATSQGQLNGFWLQHTTKAAILVPRSELAELGTLSLLIVNGNHRFGRRFLTDCLLPTAPPSLLSHPP